MRVLYIEREEEERVGRGLRAGGRPPERMSPGPGERKGAGTCSSGGGGDALLVISAHVATVFVSKYYVIKIFPGRSSLRTVFSTFLV